MKRIPLSVPYLGPETYEHVKEAIDTQWVSTGGPFIRRFEEDLASYVGVSAAAALQSGTAALHLALLLCDVKDGDYVLVPNLTFIAAINPIYYVGANPIFFDVDDSLGLDAKQVEEFLREETIMVERECRYKRDGRRISAILCVHIFGNLCDVHSLRSLADEYGLKLIEDATEALGTRDDKGFAGTFGDVGCFSFNGNKIITTGGGGMLVSRDESMTLEARRLSTQAKVDGLYSTHDAVGYNYRMTNLQAALGISQLKELEDFIAIKTENYHEYAHRLESLGLSLLPFRENTRPNYWFYSLDLGERKASRDELLTYLIDRGVDVRPIWDLMSRQKPFKHDIVLPHPVAEDYLKRIVNLPCSTTLEEDDLLRVVDLISEFYK